MNLEEYRNTYFRRWQKRLNLQCWMIFYAITLLTAIITTSMFLTKEFTLDHYAYLLIARILIPAVFQLAVMIPVKIILSRKNVNWLTGCRLIISEIFWILSVTSVVHAPYIVVLITPSLTMLLASTIADKKLINALLASSLAVFVPSTITLFLRTENHRTSFLLYVLSVCLIIIYFVYKVSKELLRSQTAQVSFITHNYKKQAALSKELQLEPLTQLYNRRALADTVEKLMPIAETKDEQIGLAFLDLDNFKSVNDTLGHAAGDAVLISLAEIIIEVLGTNRNAFRFGGDEFVILFRNKDISEISSIVETIMTKFHSQNFDYLPEEIKCTMSVGISIYKKGWNSKEWFKSADEAAYKAKKNGKNRYEIAD